MRKLSIGLLVLLLIHVGMGVSDATLEIPEVISADVLAFARIGDLPQLLTEIQRTLEQEGLTELPAYEEAKAQIQQMLPIVPMLVGVDFEDFLNLFGRELALAFYGLDGQKPVLAILVDTRHDPKLAADTIEEIRILAEANAEQLPEPGTYRGVAYEGIRNEHTSIQFAFLDNLYVVGFNGGFERVVDRMLGEGKPLSTSALYQQMAQMIDPTGQAWGYADLEALASILSQLNESQDPGQEAILSSLRNVGFKLDLTGYEQKLYLGVQEPDHPFFKPFYRLIFTQRPPMMSSAWLAETQGVWLGLNLGDLQTMFNMLVPLTGKATSKQISQQLREVSKLVGVDLRKGFLPLLSGEIALMASVPEGEFNPDKRPLDFLKLSPILFLGLEDVSGFVEAIARISDSLQGAGLVQASVLRSESVLGQEVYRLFLTVDALAPGIALTPTATIFRQQNGKGLVAISNHPDAIRKLLEMVRDTPIDGRIAAYLSVKDIVQFIARQETQAVPEPILQRLEKLTPVVAVLNTTPQELTLSLISPQSPWLVQLINGLAAGVLADQLKEQE